ncbi:MAG: HIT family protein [Candidatus Diapherotrites archaeon]
MKLKKNNSSECIFCKIAKGQIPSTKIHETKNTLAFLDIAPVNKGHTLVIPKKHFSSLQEIPEKELKETIIATKKIAIAIQKALKPDGINLIQSNGSTAGQIIMHFHMHIIPRFENDKAGFKWPKHSYQEGEAQKFQKKIAREIK